MELIKLSLILALIIIVLRLKRPLYAALLAGIAGAAVLFQVGIFQTVKIMAVSSVSEATLGLVLSFYLITFLQRMLEKRGDLVLAEQSLFGLFNSRRVNAMLAPFVIGLLPSAGAVIIAAPIVDEAGGDFISKEDKTFITSYFRHISESFLPTYASILLALQLSKVNTASFVLGMLPMVLALFLLGYVLYVRRIPKETGFAHSSDKRKDTLNLLLSLWTIVMTVAVILIFNCQVYQAVLPVIVLNLFLRKFTWSELAPMFRSAFESKLIFSTFVVMMFKDILTYTGVIGRLPNSFASLPVPTVVIFALLFLFGTMAAGTQAIIALSIPLAFAAMPGGGLALMILLMSMTYIAMQISPVHICLTIITEVYHTAFIDLVYRTLPVMGIFLIITSFYSYLIYLIQ